MIEFLSDRQYFVKKKILKSIVDSGMTYFVFEDFYFNTFMVKELEKPFYFDRLHDNLENAVFMNHGPGTLSYLYPTEFFEASILEDEDFLNNL